MLKRNAVFLTLSLMLIVALGLAILFIPKGELHLLLCDRHTAGRDFFYSHITDLAAYFPYIVCLLLLIFSRIGDGIFGFNALLFSGLVTQCCKRFANTPRPLTWFAENMPDVQLPLTEGVDMNYWYSFPSGHATSFFALAFILSIVATRWLSNKTASLSAAVQFLCFAFVALGCYSRLYLSQHFAIDILVGILIGILITMLVYAVFLPLDDKKWYNYRLFAKK